MSAEQYHPGLVHHIQPAPQDVPQNGDIHSIPREADDIQSRQGLAAHGVDIAQGISHGNPTEVVRVIDYRREKVDRLHESQVVRELIDAGVFRPLHARDEIGVGLERQAGQRFGEVARTYLAGSTRAVNGLGKAQLFFVNHPIYLFRDILLLLTRFYKQTISELNID
jgi:hypothetical protein